MQKIRFFLRSFSFRLGLVIFCILSALLMAQRMLLYLESIETAYEDIRLIIDAHEEEIDEAMEHYGAGYVKNLLASMSKDLRDKHLFLLLRQGDTLTGNLEQWPSINMAGQDYTEVILPAKNDEDPLHLLVSISEYQHGTRVLVGYDLERIDELRDELPEDLLKNLALAFGVSLTASIVIIWLLARYFRRFNQACERVMAGNLDFRIRTHHSRDEFDKLANNINRMLDWNKTLIATVKDSSNAIAHDMRTPLSRLRLELRALTERPRLDRETREGLMEQVERVDSLIEMFENILNIARAESRASTDLFEPVDLKQLIQDVLDFYVPIIEEKELELATQLPITSVFIKGDKQLLGQAMVNLIDNACKYTPPRGMVSVMLLVPGKEIHLIIADTGPGIPSDLQEKAKERFFRMDESRHTPGHGLGLSLVNAVAALHRGGLVLEDNHPGLKATLILRGVI